MTGGYYLWIIILQVKKNGILYKNGKIICETFSKGSNIKNAPDPEEIVRRIKKQTEKEE